MTNIIVIIRFIWFIMERQFYGGVILVPLFTTFNIQNKGEHLVFKILYSYWLLEI